MYLILVKHINMGVTILSSINTLLSVNISLLSAAAPTSLVLTVKTSGLKTVADLLGKEPEVFDEKIANQADFLFETRKSKIIMFLMVRRPIIWRLVRINKITELIKVQYLCDKKLSLKAAAKVPAITSCN